MKPEKFKSFGITERQANYEIAWTIGWAFVMLVISIISIFRP